MNAALIDIERLVHRGGPALRPLPAKLPLPAELPLRDRLGRQLSDLRLSVTDRCNFRCTYCMPRSKVGPVVGRTERQQLLTFEELVRIASAFVELGVDKLRITGGEPLVRRGLPTLVAKLSRLSVRDLCLTTNGSLLAAQARALAEAGLHRVTVSLDAIDDAVFRRMTDGHTAVSTVLSGIEAARKVGLGPIKINMVVQRGVNEDQILPVAAWARGEGLELRFIEYMDVGCSNGWKATDVLSAAEIRERVHEVWPVEPVTPAISSDPAERFRYLDGRGTLGIIASITRPFCGNCTRARVSSLGELYPCLFAPVGVDLATPLRSGDDLRPVIAGLWQSRRDRYSELRAATTSGQRRPEMSAIGG